VSTSYADSAQARALDARLDGSSTGGAGDNWFDDGPDPFSDRIRANEAKRLASLPGRISAAISQMEMICPPRAGGLK